MVRHEIQSATNVIGLFRGLRIPLETGVSRLNREQPIYELKKSQQLFWLGKDAENCSKKKSILIILKLMVSYEAKILGFNLSESNGRYFSFLILSGGTLAVIETLKRKLRFDEFAGKIEKSKIGETWALPKDPKQNVS